MTEKKKKERKESHIKHNYYKETALLLFGI